MRASAATIQLLTDYYEQIEANAPEKFASYYADDMTLTFANSPTIHGRTAAAAAFSDVLNRVRSLHHDLVNVWEEDDGTVIFETVGTYHLHDGRDISVNAAGVFTVVDGKFTDQRITVDNGPMFEATAASAPGATA